jgi:selenoprotein W-related protein
LTAKVLPRFKQRIGEYVMVPSRGGCFEIRVGDRLVYSKLQTGRFPGEDEAIEAIEQALG